jgi:hypothetical protein
MALHSNTLLTFLYYYLRKANVLLLGVSKMFQSNHMYTPWNVFLEYTKNLILESVTIKSLECILASFECTDSPM